MNAPPFQLASPSKFRQELADAGLNDVRVDTVTWETTFASASHFWNVVTSGHPIAVQLTREDLVMSENGRGADRAGRRAKRMLSPSQKYEIWLQRCGRR